MSDPAVVDYCHPYLSSQLIAYIGNKRALLPFLGAVFAELVPDPVGLRFLDPFAGSGGVSRLARALGMRVSANDWEVYSWLINTCHLGISAADLEGLFAPRGGIDKVLDELNALRVPCPGEDYVSRHFAPADTARADWRTERLFYTRENGLALDAMRNRIEQLYPGMPQDPRTLHEKAALLGPLLYEAATHTNTSGVFKACHRGFGGHGRDALSRIMAPVRARRPVLWDAPGAEVCCSEARVFLSGRTGDLCYVDPPYATHQYGSNYFMLTSLTLWDKPPVSDERGPDGRLRHKAGIRSDWTRTRSAFCHPRTALSAMKDTLAAADARWIVVSYSDEGIIPLDDLCDLLAAEGGLSLRSTVSVKYPGGRQSVTRTVKNSELALVVDRRERRPAAVGARATARQLLAGARLDRLMAGSFHPDRIRQCFPVRDGGIVVQGSVLAMDRLYRFAPPVSAPAFAARTDAPAFTAALESCSVRDVPEELGVVLGLLGDEQPGPGRERLLRDALRLLNKLAHPRSRELFQDWLSDLRSAGLAPAGSRFALGLEAVAERAVRRLAAAERSP